MVGRVVRLVSALMIFIAAAGCAQRRTSGELVVGTERPPLTLDPRFDIDTASENAVELIFSGLTRVNEKLEVVPDLAESYTSKDAKLFRFRLRPGIRFQSGRPVTVEDVVRTIRHIKDEKTGSPFRSLFKGVDSVTVLDRVTVEVRLSEPYAFFPLAARRPILPMEIVEREGKDFSRRPVGTGFFKLERWDEASGVELSASGVGMKYPRVRLKPILDANTRVLELMRGHVDLVQGTADSFPPGSLKLLRERRDIVLQSTSSANVQYLNFNLHHPILKDVRVRRAIASAIDRESIVKYKLSGFGRVANGMIPPIHWAFEPDVRKYPYDPMFAKKLLDEAGFPDPDGDGPKTRFRIIYKTSTNPQSIEVAEVIQHDLRAVGIDVELRSSDFGVLLEDAKRGNFEIYTMQWTSVLSPDHYFEVFHTRSAPPDGYNRNFYSNSALDHLLEEGRRTVDPAKQKKIYGEAQKIVAEDLPAVPLWFPDQVAAVRRTIGGYPLHPRGTFDSLVDVVKGIL